MEAALTERQAEAMDVLTDHENGITEVLFGGSAGGGKSYIACAWIITCCLQYPGTRYLMGRAVLKALKETTLNTFFDVCRMWGLKRDTHWTFNTKDNIIRFDEKYGGSEILLKDLFQYPSDPEFDSLGSLEITAAIIDEVSQITQKAKDIVMSRIRYKLDDYGLIPKMLLVTNPAKNWAYSQFYKPFKEGTLKEYRAFIPALPGDNEFLSDHYVHNLEKLEDAEKQRLLYGNWEYDDDSATMIKYAKIVECFRPKNLGGRRYISADIARMGRDKTVVGVWEGMMLIRIETMAKNKIPEAADLIKRLRFEHKVHSENIVIDQDGLGSGVLDLIDGAVGIVNNAAPIRVEGQKENFSNLKSQLYFYLANYVNNEKIYIRCSAEQRELITAELETVKKKNVDNDGKFSVLPKQEVKELIGRSPDYSDMLAYRMWFEITNQSRYI